MMARSECPGTLATVLSTLHNPIATLPAARQADSSKIVAVTLSLQVAQSHADALVMTASHRNTGLQGIGLRGKRGSGEEHRSGKGKQSADLHHLLSSGLQI